MCASVMYVTEPDAINIELATQVLVERDVKLVEGDVEFRGSTERDYDTLLIRSTTVVGSDIKQYFPGLKNIVRVGVGLDNIDLDYCKQAGISVYNAPGANADAVSDYTIAMVLYALRRLHMLDEDGVREWDRFKFKGEAVADQIIGIVGFGNIGRLLYEKLKGFSVHEFYVYDPYLSAGDMPADNVHLVSINELLQKSSVVSLHLPLIPETHHIIDESALDLLHDGAIVINAARGGIVDEAAVLSLAPERGIIYVADVVEGEPQVNPGLLQNDNVIVTPHIASLTTRSDRQMLTLALANFLQDKKVRL